MENSIIRYHTRTLSFLKETEGGESEGLGLGLFR